MWILKYPMKRTYQIIFVIMALHYCFSQRNVLKFKPYARSSSLDPASYAVDGDTNPLKYFHVDFEPLREYWLIVDMIMSYKIEYVVLWSRLGPTYTARNDYFIIGLTNVNYFNLSTGETIRGRFPLCGQYLTTTKSAAPHRLNCTSKVPPYRYVIAQQKLGQPFGFAVAELEAFPLNGIKSLASVEWDEIERIRSSFERNQECSRLCDILLAACRLFLC
ncbi:hypothetical protein HELRODRAFT_177427 [Helobdella robusta]|uniref:Uncharacterized protein n=1 Tax=Helobdella robusta TaxID=6412 RepID=T1FBP1_HELRO|nr:hypothetical protein HELRODRAFT_177427 [Helobdella robusta]ESN98181.1 hypothetical protein HELRODRAFT_177427 [Helobdella robusta]